MISSRLVAATRILGSRLAQSSGPRQIVRHGHGVWSYRSANPPPKMLVVGAEVAGGLMWWWILWHLYHDPGAITGHFPYPDISAWTNEELGIPPDDAE